MSRLVIEAGRTDALYWKDLWKYRELFFFLSWRDILVRYKQTTIGILWAVIRPVLTSVIMVFVFGRLGKMSVPGDTPYILIVFSAMLPWQFFASALGDSSNSLIASSNMISKIYFPRLVIPASAIMVGLADFLISFVILLVIMCWCHVFPTWRIFAIIPFMTLAIMSAFGAGLWFAALNVEYRDFRYIIPFVTQIGMYVSPVGFKSSIVPAHLQIWYSLNPMVGVIDGFRWATGAIPSFHWENLLSSLSVALFLCAGGIWYFRKTEAAFADVI